MKKPILLVEDDDGIATPLTKLLKIRGFEVDWSDTGPKALERFQSGESYSIVLLDVMMPQMDGWEVATRIRAMDSINQPEIIFLSADTQSKAKAEEKGFRFVAKPLDLEELTGLLKEMQNRI